MTTLGTFYKQTWWLWLLFAAALIALAYYTSLIFLFGLPILIAYSVFFGFLRVAEIRREEMDQSKPPSEQK